MERHENGALRPGWEAQIVAQGLVFNEDHVPRPDGGFDVRSYWREAQYYSFTGAEIDELAAAGNTILDRMLVPAAEQVIEQRRYAELAIPSWAVPAIERSWEEDSPSVIGRFDLRYGNRPDLVAADPRLAVPALLEYNADTPTSLLESTAIQWNWLLTNDAVAGRDQWNNVYEALVLAWQRNLSRFSAQTGRAVHTVHLAWSSADTSGEDQMTVLAMADAVQEAGYRVELLHTEDIRLAEEPEAIDFAGTRVHPGRFLDAAGRSLDVVFKLYPWEMLAEDPFGRTALWDAARAGGTVWVEPPYKMLWSNKGILAVLWEMFGDDPELSRFLLPTYFAGREPAGFTSYAEKPLLGREGANVRLVRDGQTVHAEPGPYGAEGSVRQLLAPLPDFAGVDGPHHPVLGVWMVDGEAAGLGLRESDGLITDNLSSFVPHCLIDPA